MTEAPRPNDTRYYERVGRVACAWATFDVNLDLTIAVLTSMNAYETACITSQFSSHYPKLKAITALCEFKGVSAKTLKALKQFTGSIASLTERRNRAIHDAWMAKDGQIVGRFNVKTLRLYEGPDPAEELESLVAAINKKIETFNKIRADILSELRSSRKKSP